MAVFRCDAFLVQARPKALLRPRSNSGGVFLWRQLAEKDPILTHRRGLKAAARGGYEWGYRLPSTPSGAVRFSAFLFGLGVRGGRIHPVSRPPLIAVRSSALLFVGSFAIPVLHSITPMLYYRSCIGLWCCRAPPLSGALCKEISVIYDGKSVARSGVLCKGISVTCNGKTQRLFGRSVTVA